jgi:hypothetical protein
MSLKSFMISSDVFCPKFLLWFIYWDNERLVNDALAMATPSDCHRASLDLVIHSIEDLLE